MTKQKAKGSQTLNRVTPPRGKAKTNFYERALSEAEAEYLKRATNVDGLDQEIAVLRTKILTTLEEHPERRRHVHERHRHALSHACRTAPAWGQGGAGPL